MNSLPVRLTSVVSIAAAISLLAVPLPAHAVDCGDDQILNGDFESPVLGDLVEADIIDIASWGGRVWDAVNTPPVWAMVESLPSVDTSVSQDLVWQATEGAVEIQQAPGGGSGNQWAEITGIDVSNTLYQTVETVPGTVMTWTLAHRGLSGVDVMQVEIGATVETLVPQEATPETGTGNGNPVHISDGTTWRTWTGTYAVPDGQTSTVFGFAGVSSSTGDPTTGNLIDDIGFTCDVELTNEANEEEPEDNSAGGASELANTGFEANAWVTLSTTGLLFIAAAFVLFLGQRLLRRSRRN